MFSHAFSLVDRMIWNSHFLYLREKLLFWDPSRLRHPLLACRNTFSQELLEGSRQSLHVTPVIHPETLYKQHLKESCRAHQKCLLLSPKQKEKHDVSKDDIGRAKAQAEAHTTMRSPRSLYSLGCPSHRQNKIPTGEVKKYCFGPRVGHFYRQ